MPILKQHTALPATKDAIVLDLADIGAQAERLRAAARVQAEKIIAEGRAQAEALTADAEQIGYDKGLAEGLAKGEAQGREQGRAEALAETADRLTALAAAWSDALTRWDQSAEALRRDARQAVLDFALKLTERLLHRVVEADATVVLDQIDQALAHVLAPLDVTVRVHSGDRELVDDALPTIAARFGHLKHIETAADDAVGPGGCVVTYGQGAVDATIANQIQRVMDHLRPGATATKPAPAASADPASAGRDTSPEPTPDNDDTPKPRKRPRRPSK